MCGRYTSTTSAEVLAAAFAVDEVVADELGPRWNVAPTQPILAVATHRARDDRPERRALGTFRWGLVPSWAKDPSVGSRMINARAEGIGDKAAYRSALLRRRCIIPADAFYEWQAVGAAPGASGAPGARGRRKPVKVPHVIRRRDGAPMAFAGLWEVWRDRGDPDAPLLRSAAIITTAANSVLAPIHDRMPVILEPADWDTWLDPSVGERAVVEALLRPAADDVVEAYAVGTRVNKVAEDGPDLVAPVAVGA